MMADEHHYPRTDKAVYIEMGQAARERGDTTNAALCDAMATLEIRRATRWIRFGPMLSLSNAAISLNEETVR